MYGMFPSDIQEQIDQGTYRGNTIDYTDARDPFGTLNDDFPQVGVQHFVKNKKILIGNHMTKHFSHLFLLDGEIILMPNTIRELARKTDELHGNIKGSYDEIDQFSERHDNVIASTQFHFEGQVGYHYDRLKASGVTEIINKLAKSISGGKLKFYDTKSEEWLLLSLADLEKMHWTFEII